MRVQVSPSAQLTKHFSCVNTYLVENSQPDLLKKVMTMGFFWTTATSVSSTEKNDSVFLICKIMRWSRNMTAIEQFLAERNRKGEYDEYIFVYDKYGPKLYFVEANGSTKIVTQGGFFWRTATIRSIEKGRHVFNLNITMRWNKNMADVEQFLPRINNKGRYDEYLFTYNKEGLRLYFVGEDGSTARINLGQLFWTTAYYLESQGEKSIIENAEILRWALSMEDLQKFFQENSKKGEFKKIFVYNKNGLEHYSVRGNGEVELIEY
ncbi:MAG TPA: hypothetical protein PKI00_01815 [Candidatus Pacearchaeota archaeon]|nr:hypothetical protein [Candidatus Pacearchaeota archaeon]